MKVSGNAKDGGHFHDTRFESPETEDQSNIDEDWTSPETVQKYIITQTSTENFEEPQRRKYFILELRIKGMESLVDFALQERYKQVKDLGDRLGELAPLIEWESFREIVGDIYTNILIQQNWVGGQILTSFS